MFEHRGAVRQRTLRHALDRLPPSNRALHSLRSPTSGNLIQHLIVNACGIFLVDVVKASGSAKVRDDTLWLGRHDLGQQCDGAHRLAAEVGRFFRHSVTPVLCVSGAKLPAPVLHLRHVVICDEELLIQYVSSGPRCLDTRSVQLLAERGATLVRTFTAPVGRPIPLPPPSSRAASRRQPHPPPTPTTSRRRRAGHQILGTAAGTVVCIVGAWVIPSLAHLTDARVDQFVRATDRTRPQELDTAPATSSPASASADAEPALPLPPADSSIQPALLPTLDFTCPVPGQGWVAAASPTGSDSDPVGYHLWYETATGTWHYWGHFASGVEAPPPLTGLAPGDSLDVRMGRDFQPNGDDASTMLTFTAPDGSC